MTERRESSPGLMKRRLLCGILRRAGICRKGENVKRFVYIHGFNSGGQSRSGRELGRLLDENVICPEYDYARPFAVCLSDIRRQISEAVDDREDRLCVMGSSLGGFYALQLRLPAIVQVAVWNPVVFPAMQMEQFLGRNTRFSDGREWEFTRDVMLSYAQAPDPRPWYNGIRDCESRLQEGKNTDTRLFVSDGEPDFRYDAEEGAGAPVSGKTPRRDIFLGNSDEILDARLARAFWQGWARLHDIVSGHQIMDYSHAADILKSDCTL